MKTIADLRIGDSVWMHAGRGVDSEKKVIVLQPGTVERRAGGFLRCVFPRGGRKSILQKRFDSSHDNDYCRFSYGEFGGSVYIYSDETAAVLGLWKMDHATYVAAQISKAPAHTLYEIAKLIGYESLPDFTK